MSVPHPSWSESGWSERGHAPWVLDGDHDPAPPPVLDRPVLVTAFGPFPDHPVNPSEVVVDALAGDEDVVGHVLDVSYRRAPEQLDALVRMVDPAAVVCVGVGSGSSVVRLETSARSHDTSSAPDVDGEVRAGRRIDTGPTSLATRLDVEAMAAALTAVDVPVERSDDAGGFVCNHVFRHALTSLDLLERPVGFVHVPEFGSPGFDLVAYGLVGRVVVDVVTGQVLAQRVA